jgi:hypothetical protein
MHDGWGALAGLAVGVAFVWLGRHMGGPRG